MPNVHDLANRREAHRRYAASLHGLPKRREAQRRYAASLHGKDKHNAYNRNRRIVKDTPQIKQEASARSAEWYARNVEKKRAYNAEYRQRKSQKIEGQKTLMQAWEKARAPSDSAVLPPRFILHGVALASPDSAESELHRSRGV